MDAKAVGIGADFDQLGYEAIDVHTGVGLAGGCAVSAARPSENRRTGGARSIRSGSGRHTAGERLQERNEKQEFDEGTYHQDTFTPALMVFFASAGAWPRSFAIIGGRCFNK